MLCGCQTLALTGENKERNRISENKMDEVTGGRTKDIIISFIIGRLLLIL
jgi:hypothetical protein